ncbi:hypothetical protein A2436_01490 [candidate division WS6 bacterium RIFOXYC1_FULL_33_9]|nr:MAG: hypothetical protein A2369_00940 [candidate division WS6 bacterium RIFOXYB1_FULL_33_15]OGC38193.1 MAG: hypothetical protein A2436_01490 [candidate division WS6 bacterium RIFOXYC1_FULL_33_9]
MSPVTVDPKGHTMWLPERENKSLLNFEKHNEQEIFEKTILATARCISYNDRGLLSDEDFFIGLEKNAEHLNNMPPEILLELAHQVLDAKLEDDKNAD